MNTISLTKITQDEVLELQKIGRLTFYETFSESNTEENIKNHLESGFSIDKLTAELNDENAEFYFSKIQNNVIGYLKLNFGASQTELKTEKAIEIERIYVLKDYH